MSEMEAANELKRLTSGIRIRSVALPAEHGGWSMLLEPIVLGLRLVPPWPGACLALALAGAFLARHPFKLRVGKGGSNHPLGGTVVAAGFDFLFIRLPDSAP